MSVYKFSIIPTKTTIELAKVILVYTEKQGTIEANSGSKNYAAEGQ
jgi:hypothetical protein